MPNIAITLEEVGRTQKLLIEVNCEYRTIHGEDRIDRYADGSGYPGSPDEHELVGCRVRSIESDDYCHQRSDRPDWFQLLDTVVQRIVADRWSGLVDAQVLHAA